MKTLNSQTCASAFEKILNDPVTRRLPLRRLTTDRGVEFRGQFTTFINTNTLIKHDYTHGGSLNKACYAELAIKLIKARLGKAMADDRRNVAGKINAIVLALNNETHSETRPNGIAPSDLVIEARSRTRPNAPTASCSELIEKTLLHYRRYQSVKNAHAIVKGQRQRFKIGDRVRICIERQAVATKVSDVSWSSESYEVINVVNTSPVLSYRLALITRDNVKIALDGSYSEIKLKHDHSIDRKRQRR